MHSSARSTSSPPSPNSPANPCPDAGPDSQKQLRALTGTDRHGRDHLVQQAASLSLRQGRWKFIEPSRGPALNRQVNIETGNHPEPQLYDLQSDPGETQNLATTESSRLAEMQQLLNQLRAPR
ncbi:MAG UNVERIFIED_CONTAM: hypothetical protein LVR18_30320 [Planctomycetaceae bacterium]|jgi:arylsulfatase A-like enzyme